MGRPHTLFQEEVSRTFLSSANFSEAGLLPGVPIPALPDLKCHTILWCPGLRLNRRDLEFSFRLVRVSSPFGTLPDTVYSQSARRGLLREGICLHPPSVKAKAPGGWAPAVRSQSQAPGVAVAPRSARAPPPPRSRSRSPSLRPNPVLVAAGPGQTDFLLFCRAEGCRLRVTGYGLRATGYRLRASGEVTGGVGTSLPTRVPTTLPRAGGDSGRPGAERAGRVPGRCGVAAEERSARQHRSLGGEWRGESGWVAVLPVHIEQTRITWATAREGRVVSGSCVRTRSLLSSLCTGSYQLKTL